MPCWKTSVRSATQICLDYQQNQHLGGLSLLLDSKKGAVFHRPNYPYWLARFSASPQMGECLTPSAVVWLRVREFLQQSDRLIP